MLELINVKKTYVTKVGNTNALNGLSLNFPDNGLVFVTGKSGCGKTTLLNCVGGLDSIDDGEIVIDGKRFSDFTAKDYDSYRNTFIGFIFQEYNLLPDYTIEKNIQIANELQGIETEKQTIDDILKLVDLEGLNLRKPSQLSGGQKQRVAIARALVKNPKIIMADEPTGALDSVTGIQMMETLKKLSKQKLVIIVSHDLELAERFADRIIRLVDGQLVEDITLTDTEIISNVFSEGDSIIVKNGSELDANETATLLKGIKEKKQIKFTEKIDVRTKNPTPKIKAVHPENPTPFVNSKMKFKSSAGLGIRSLKVKPIRLIMTIILSVIAFALFGVFDTIGAYSDTRSIANLLRSKSYNTIVLNSSYANGSTAGAIRVSQKTIDDINDQTGYEFRGTYEIYDKFANGMVKGAPIIEINSEQRTGEQYYYNYLDDFIEFSSSEIVNNVIDPDGFNYKILHGSYPTLMVDENDDLTEPVSAKSFTDVAISKYMAESIIFWLQAEVGEDANGNPLSIRLKDEDFVDKEINGISDLVGCRITLNNAYELEDGQKMFYVIRGIVDCGDVPEKFISLKTSFPNANTQSLANDLSTFINTNAHLKLFVPKGYVAKWREYNDRENVSYASGYNTKLVYDGQKTLSLTYSNGNTNVTGYYNYSKDFIDSDKIFLFKNADSITDEQVIISAKMVRPLFMKEFNTFTDGNKDKANTINNLLSRIESRSVSLEDKIDSFNLLYFMCNNSNGLPQKEIVLQQKNVVSNKTTLHTFQIAGVYFDVNSDISDTGLYKNNPLMLTKKGLEKLGVCTTQGIYARMIAPINTSYFNANKMATRIADKSDVRVNWYENSVLTSISSNKEQLQKFANLFLYVAILLAAFSIFMLFNYISTSIVSKRPSIGILRALGSNGRDVFRMFFTESIVISLINGVLACGVAALGCMLVNTYIRNIMNLTINFAIFGARQIIIIVLASIFTGILSSLLPIIKICKEKPVDLIRKN